MKSILSNILLTFFLASGLQIVASSPIDAYKKNSYTHNAAYKQLVESKELLKEAEQIFQADQLKEAEPKTPNLTQILYAISTAKELFNKTSQDITNNYSSKQAKEISQIIDRYQKAIKILEQLQINLSQINQNSSQQIIEKAYHDANSQIEKACSQVNLAKAKLFIFQKSISLVSSKN